MKGRCFLCASFLTAVGEKSSFVSDIKYYKYKTNMFSVFPFKTFPQQGSNNRNTNFAYRK